MKFRMIPLFVMLSSLMLLGSLAIAQPTPPTSPATASADEAILLRTLVERLAGLQPGEQLIVGDLPETLPPEMLPMPNDAQILGSLARSGNHTWILLESQQSPSEIEAFYAAELPSRGWREEQSSLLTWGFSQADTHEQFAASPSIPMFCANDENMMLQIIVQHAVPSQQTGVQLIMMPTGVMGSSPVCSDEVTQLPTLPSLHLPSGVNITSGSAGREEYLIRTEVVVTTTTPRAEILSHLADQFDQAGWRSVERVDDDGLSWATWRSENEQGETWQGAINIVKLQGAADTYLVRAHVEKQDV